MPAESERRLIIAFGAAPLATVPVLALSLWLSAGASPSDAATVARLGHVSVFLAIGGLPIAYAVELGICLPIYLRWLQGRAAPGRVIIPLATVLGSAVMPLAWWAALGGSLAWDLAWTGAAMGLAAGLTFVGIVAVGTGRPAIQPGIATGTQERRQVRRAVKRV